MAHAEIETDSMFEEMTCNLLNHYFNGLSNFDRRL